MSNYKRVWPDLDWIESTMDVEYTHGGYIIWKNVPYYVIEVMKIVYMKDNKYDLTLGDIYTDDEAYSIELPENYMIQIPTVDSGEFELTGFGENNRVILKDFKFDIDLPDAQIYDEDRIGELRFAYDKNKKIICEVLHAKWSDEGTEKSIKREYKIVSWQICDRNPDEVKLPSHENHEDNNRDDDEEEQGNKKDSNQQKNGDHRQNESDEEMGGDDEKEVGDDNDSDSGDLEDYDPEDEDENDNE